MARLVLAALELVVIGAFCVEMIAVADLTDFRREETGASVLETSAPASRTHLEGTPR